MARHSDQRFPGARGRRQDDVIARQEFEDGLFLGWVELESDRGAVVDEGIDEFVWFSARGREMVEKGDAAA